MELFEILRAPLTELPVCACDAWSEGLPTLGDDSGKLIYAFALLIRDRGVTEEGAKIALAEWSSNKVLAESEISRAYASNEKLNCKLLQSIRYLADRCEKDFCDFPAWRSQNKSRKARTKAESKESAPDKRVLRIAENIMKRGDPLKYLVQQAQRNHIGDTDVLKHLLASISCTNSATSSGIQPELNGPKGHGKTDSVKAAFHLIPPKFKLAISISAKALYYHDLLPGTIIFSDDVKWSDDLISTVKRSMGSFQEPQTHFTLDKNREPLAHTMPARLAWWLSSVESVADDQLKDRQYSLDIEDSKDHSIQVSDFIRKSRANKSIRFSVDWRIEIAREIIRRIKEHDPFKVVIDCAEVADWKVKEDHRTQNKFWDLVEAFAIIRFEQRYIDEDGWLHATIEDFKEAKSIFMKRKANHRTHLTNAQTKIVKSVIALQKETEGATQSRIAEDQGISIAAVSKSLIAIEANTRFIVHQPGVHGEKFYRCTVAALEIIYAEGDIVTLPDDYKDPFNPNQPPFNHDSTNHSTSKNDNSNTNYTTIQPNQEEYSNDREVESGEDKVESKHCYTSENGLKVESKATDSEKPSLIVVESQSKASPDSGTMRLIVVRFLHEVPAFSGVDGLVHGPFRPEDVATIPHIHAQGLFKKNAVVGVNGK